MTCIVAVALVVAALGCVIPVLPGGFLALAAIALWAVVEQSLTGWLVLVLATLLILAGQVVKYVWPGRRLARSGVLARSILAGGLLGIVGFFVVPVVGLPLGFVLGIFLAELARADGVLRRLGVHGGGPQGDRTVGARRAGERPARRRRVGHRPGDGRLTASRGAVASPGP